MIKSKIQGKLACILVSFCLLVPVMVNAQKEERKLQNFENISLNISADVILTQGNNFSVVLDGSKVDLEKITTEVEGSTLKIKTKPHSRIDDVKIYIEMPKIEELSVAGSGSIKAEKTVKTEDIELTVSGSGDIILNDLQSSETEANVTGSGDIELKGKNADEFEANVTGSGDIKAEDFETKEAEVNITGSGSVKVYATSELETNIVGSGSVRYKGNPLINATATGSGNTRPL